MNEGQVDILIPTQGIRANGLIYQIDAFRNQSYNNCKIWVLIDNPEESKLIKSRLKSRLPYATSVELIEVPLEWSGNWGHRPIRYAIEELPLEGEWVLTSGDDDCVMEWGVERLVEDSHDVDMVVGICKAVGRNHDAKFVNLGEIMAFGQITGSCCLYRRSRLTEIGYDDSCYEADWVLIQKMMEHPYRQIKSCIMVMPQSF